MASGTARKARAIGFDLAQRTATILAPGANIAPQMSRQLQLCRARDTDAHDGMVDAVKLLAQTEGLLFDPVYSGKGLDGLIT